MDHSTYTTMQKLCKELKFQRNISYMIVLLALFNLVYPTYTSVLFIVLSTIVFLRNFIKHHFTRVLLYLVDEGEDVEEFLE